MKRFLMISAMLTLSACGTPQERCIAEVSGNLTIVDLLIGEAEENLARGFAYAEVVQTMPQFVDCTPKPTLAQPNPAPRQCLVEVARTVNRPVAIDLNAEAAKLAGLKAKRGQLATSTSTGIASCRQKFPE